MGNGTCGINEYADSRGIPRATLKGIIGDPVKRVKASIAFGYDAVNKTIYPDILDKEWFFRYKVEQQEKGKVFTPKSVNKELAVVDPADAEAMKIVWAAAEKGNSDEESEGGSDFGFNGRVNFIEAQRVWMANKARREKMEADKLEGILVPRDEVNRQLMVAGMEVRKELERLPTLCVDAVRGAKTRQDGIIAMQDTIMQMLEKLPALIENALKPKE